MVTPPDAIMTTKTMMMMMMMMMVMVMMMLMMMMTATQYNTIAQHSPLADAMIRGPPTALEG